MRTQAQQVAFQNWSQADGLPVSAINHILYDSRHYFWLATEGGGLVRYDGRDFKSYGPENGLPALYINQLYEAPNGHLWLAASNGLFVFDGLRFSTILADVPLFCICAASDGNLYAGSPAGLLLLPPNATPALVAKTPTNVRSCLGLFDGQLAIGTEAGFFLWRPNSDSETALAANYLLVNDEVKSFALVGQELFVGTQAGLFVMGGTHHKPTPLQVRNRLGQPVNFADVRALAAGPDSTLWAGSYTAGLASFDRLGEQSAFFGPSEGLPKGRVRALGAAFSGNIWLGTLDGLSRLVDPRIVQYNNGPNLPNGPVTAIHQSADGTIWYGTAAGVGFWPYNAQTAAKNFPQGLVFSIKEQPERKTLWLGTESGLVRVQNGQVTHLPKKFSDSVTFVFSVLPHLNAVWVGAASGLYQYQNQTLTPFPDARLQNIPVNNITRFGNQILVGTIGAGVWNILPGGTVQQIPDSEDWNVAAIATVGRFAVLGTNGTGMVVWDGQQAKTYKMANGLLSDNVWALSTNNTGGFWLGTEKGLQQVQLSASGQPVFTQKIALQNGLLNQEISRNALFYHAANNSLVVGTNSGFATIALSKAVEATPQVHLHINSMRLFFKDLDASWGQLPFSTLPKNRVFSHNENYFSFQFSASAPAQAEVQYRYILRGQDQAFTPAGPTMEAVFTNIPPGKYIFEVQAVAREVVLGKTTLAFQIRPAFWQTNWFWALVVGVLGLMVYLLVQQRIKNLNARLALEAEKADWERKALRLQMNPHFIFNALDGITAFIFKNEPQKAVRYLSNFAKLMRLTLESSREGYIALETEENILKNYLELEQLRFSSQFSYHIEMEADLDPYTEIPPMMIQPHVENAILHGLRPLENREGKVTITFKKGTSDTVVVAITDNGVGRKQAAAIKARSGVHHNSLAGEITENRMALMRKTGGGPYEMHIVDLMDGTQALGTQVVLTLPGKFDNTEDD